MTEERYLRYAGRVHDSLRGDQNGPAIAWLIIIAAGILVGAEQFLRAYIQRWHHFRGWGQMFGACLLSLIALCFLLVAWACWREMRASKALKALRKARRMDLRRAVHIYECAPERREIDRQIAEAQKKAREEQVPRMRLLAALGDEKAKERLGSRHEGPEDMRDAEWSGY